MIKILLLLFLSSNAFAQTYIKGPALIESVTSTATAAGTTTLTKDSQTNQVLTGATTQTVVLPDASTLPVGRRFEITNQSTGTVTVNFNGGSLAKTLVSLMKGTFVLRTASAGAGTWDIAVFPVTLMPLSNGGTNAALTAANGAIPYSTASAFAFLAPGTSGQILRSGGAGAPTWSTATFPATAGTSGTLLQSNGTNWVNTTATYPGTAGTASTWLSSNGTNWVNSTATLPTTAAGTGTILRADGTNWAATTATYPTTTTANQILRSTATNVVGGDTTLTWNGSTLGVTQTSTADVTATFTAGGSAQAANINIVGTGTGSGAGFNNITSKTGATTYWQIGGKGAADTLAISTGSGVTEAMRVNSTQQVLIGATASGGSNDARLQVAGTTIDTAAQEIVAYSATASTGARTEYSRSRGASVGTNTVVQSGDRLGTISFTGANGTGYNNAVQIRVEVDGTPGAGDMPGRIVFFTTPDGSSTVTERMRINNAGDVSIAGLTASRSVVTDGSKVLTSASGLSPTVPGAAAMKTILGKFTTSGASTCTENIDPGSQYTTTGVSTGTCTINFTANFASEPICTCMTTVASGFCNSGTASTSAITFRIKDDTNTSQNGTIYFNCVGFE